MKEIGGHPLLYEEGLTLRFVVGEVEQPPWSGTWVAWGNEGKGDIYVASRSIAGDLKVSLHQSGECRFALTSQHLRKPGRVANNRNSLVWQMRENMGVPGMSRPLVINFPSSELHPMVEPPKKAPLVFVAPAAPGGMTEISVVFTAPGITTDPWPGAHQGISFLAVYDLPLLGKAWFLAREIDIPSDFAAQIETHRKIMNRFKVPPDVAGNEPGAYRALLVSDLQNDTRHLTEILLSPAVNE
jgi:hypothetical protein